MADPRRQRGRPACDPVVLRRALARDLRRSALHAAPGEPARRADRLNRGAAHRANPDRDPPGVWRALSACNLSLWAPLRRLSGQARHGSGRPVPC